MTDLSVLIVTGLSGSGKSTLVRALEDQGFFCVDNMPVELIERLINMVETAGSTSRLALVIDARSGQFLAEAPAVIQRLKKGRNPIRLLYVEAREDAVLRRYSETRRKHPLDQGEGLRAAFGKEQALLAPLRELADDTLDTSAFSPHDLRAEVGHRFGGSAAGDDLRLAVMSFGFKYGLPLDADMVFDVRFLPNPYFVEELRALSGLDERVQRYVLGSQPGQEFIQQSARFLRYLVPEFRKESKHYLTVAVGCTGGRHRSVAIAQALGDQLIRAGHRVDLRHRDIEEHTS
jgi:RNase adapter protein RapZ